MRPISGLSSCAARLRMHDALAALLVASPGSGATWAPDPSPRAFGRAFGSVQVVDGTRNAAPLTHQAHPAVDLPQERAEVAAGGAPAGSRCFRGLRG